MNAHLLGTVDVRLSVEANSEVANLDDARKSNISEFSNTLWWFPTLRHRKYVGIENVTHWIVLTIKDSGAGISAVRDFIQIHQ